MRLWNASTGEHLKTLTGHTETINSVCFSPDGTTVISGSNDKTVRLWNASTGEHLKTLTGHSESVRIVCFSPDGRTIASGSSDKTLRLWSTTTGKHLKTLIGHTETINSVCFSPDGATIVSADRKFIQLWDVDTGHLQKPQFQHMGSVHSVCFSPDGQAIACGDEDGLIRLWSIKTRYHKRTLKEDAPENTYIPIGNVSFSPDGRIIASSQGWTNTILIWDADTGHLKKSLIRHVRKFATFTRSFCFSPDSQMIASGGSYGDIRLWSTATWQLQKTIGGNLNPPEHTLDVLTMCFSPDGKIIASGSMDNTVKLWYVSTGKHIRTLTGHKDDVRSVCFSLDGRTIVSACWKTLLLWDASSGQLLRTFGKREFYSNSPDHYFNSVCFSPDGGTIASGSFYNGIQLWSVSTSQLRKTFSGHTKSVKSVCFSPDGQTLASGSWDGTMLLWNTGMSTPLPQPQDSTQESEQQTSTPLTPQQIAKKALAATVLIVMEDANGKPLSSGSGFFIEKRLIATNHHVVENGRKRIYKQVGKDKWYSITDTG